MVRSLGGFGIIYQLPSIIYQLPSINYQLPSINYQLPSTNYQLPSINYHLSSTNYHLSTTNYQRKGAGFSRAAGVCPRMKKRKSRGGASDASAPARSFGAGAELHRPRFSLRARARRCFAPDPQGRAGANASGASLRFSRLSSDIRHSIIRLFENSIISQPQTTQPPLVWYGPA